MLNNYLRTAVRALAKQKLHLGLNLFGLSVGLAATLLILLWARHETSYDSMHPGAEQSYRLTQTFIEMDMSVPLGSPLFKGDFERLPGVTGTTRLAWLFAPYNVVSRRGENYRLQDYYGSDRQLLDFFAIQPLAGSLEEALDRPGKLALSRSEAERLFGSENPIGQSLGWGEDNLVIAAVFEDLPANSHLTLSGFTALETLRSKMGDGLDNAARNFAYNFLRVSSPDQLPALERQITEYINGRVYNGQQIVRAGLQPLLDIHLHSALVAEMKANGSIQSVWMALALAVFILLVASFNFINLATARSGLRAKEVGVRKSLGASRGQLIGQFLTESVLLTALATLLACVWTELSLPLFAAMMNVELSLDYLSEFGLLLPALVLVVGLLAGAYPAFYLSAFNPARVLSGDMNRGKSSIRMRKTLVWLQSAISIGLLICTYALYAQLQYLQNQPLGYDKEQLMMVSGLPAKIYGQQDSLAVQLDGLDGIQGWTMIGQSPTDTIDISSGVTSNGTELDFVGELGAGFDLARTLELKLLAGRDFERRFQGDWFDANTGRGAVIINREAALQFGYADPAAAIGQPWLAGDDFQGHIVGVVENIKRGNGSDLAKPMFYALGYSRSTSAQLLIRFDNTEVPALVARAEAALKRVLPDQVFDVSFLDAQYQALFDNQRRQQQLLLSFSGLAILLTCVGLFGLAAFSCERRTREIAVRKVLGAERGGLVALISKEFLVLVLAGSLLAWPLSWWALDAWLGHFADRIALSPLWFPAATLAMLALAWLTVAALAFKAASTRPALALRYE
ncbi:FtsX-like permease family protein [Gallaecimonas sp. GXIMD4217]|uniref:ABC transporter permease n=1 Tax=Gallaecimonas sp. GXIMD4217 TaxID=3131927 RepID=UPI00311AC836